MFPFGPIVSGSIASGQCFTTHIASGMVLSGNYAGKNSVLLTSSGLMASFYPEPQPDPKQETWRDRPPLL